MYHIFNLLCKDIDIFIKFGCYIYKIITARINNCKQK